MRGALPWVKGTLCASCWGGYFLSFSPAEKFHPSRGRPPRSDHQSPSKLFRSPLGTGTTLVLLPSARTGSFWNFARHSPILGLGGFTTDLRPKTFSSANFLISLTPVCPPAPSGARERSVLSLLELPAASRFLPEDFHVLFPPPWKAFAPRYLPVCSFASS